MTTETVATATLSVSATLPATNDAAGFAALIWTPIGELTDIGSVKGRSYNTSTHAPIASAQQIEKKASYKLGNADMTVGWDSADAGQVIIETGANSNTATYAFKLVKQGGGIRYFTAQVMSFVENMGSVDNVVQGQFTLLRQTDTISV
ncbi:hypothetical protein [Rhodoferax ferrireducens]|uniref:hypothetical protein n=1 Tax=Rhodoferax ferrireducens TaxID=192843 RepID=UPI000E0D6AA3|nr:hypothetical protein [Rhodoferax ferrireducens]